MPITQNSIDLLVQETLRMGVTEERIVESLRQLSTPFDRLGYLNRLLSYGNAYSATPILERSLVSRIAELQNPEIEEARKVAETDALTGAYNRRHIEQERRKPKANYSALMIDVDHFKNVNDTYGHSVGDAVLKAVFTIIHANCREDYIGRYGGEEFLVELNNTDKYGASRAAERIRKAIEENCVPETIAEMRKPGLEVPQNFRPIPITVSIGIADGKQGHNPINVRNNADIASYKAKERRNAVVIYETGMAK